MVAGPVSSTPLSYLGLISSALRQQSLLTTKIQHTEVSALHGLGLGSLPSLTGIFSLGTHALSKLLIRLIVVFILA